MPVYTYSFLGLVHSSLIWLLPLLASLKVICSCKVPVSFFSWTSPSLTPYPPVPITVFSQGNRVTMGITGWRTYYRNKIFHNWASSWRSKARKWYWIIRGAVTQSKKPDVSNHLRREPSGNVCGNFDVDGASASVGPAKYLVVGLGSLLANRAMVRRRAKAC